MALNTWNWYWTHGIVQYHIFLKDPKQELRLICLRK